MTALDRIRIFRDRIADSVPLSKGVRIIRDIAPDGYTVADVAVTPDSTSHPLTNWNETRRLDILPPRRSGMCRCRLVFITDV